MQNLAPLFLNDAVYGQQNTEQMLLLLTAMSDTDVSLGSLVLVAPCQKKGSLSPQMTLLSETNRSEWEKEGCLVCGTRTHPCKTCYDDIPDLLGVNIVRRCHSTNRLQITFKDSEQAALQSQKCIFMVKFSVVYFYIHNHVSLMKHHISSVTLDHNRCS